LPLSLKYVCIHAHLYQPPRENPWLGEVEREKSAAPYHDWNQRITRECYYANTASRVLRRERISEIVNNYEKISFNFGPTLFSWLERQEPDVYRKIVESDATSAKQHSGHGNAIAQVYNHSIMPLNSPRDKETQILWGIRDFEYRFGRKPEGIWFAETAVDSESLSIAARHGIKFTLLAPSQAGKIRRLDRNRTAGTVAPDNDEDGWQGFSDGVDTARPYIFRPDEESEIAIFFYHGALSHSVAFNSALADGINFGNSILNAFSADGKGGDEARIVSIGTDGESYGHHHRFGEMALSSAIKTIEATGDVKVCNFGEFLEKHPPAWEVKIVENSSWSCAHGVERWRSDCGCTTGSEPGWNQKWRGPMREAVEYLKNKLDAIFEAKGSNYFKAPWEARNDYVGMILEREGRAGDKFFEKHSAKPLNDAEVTLALKLLEMQSAAMKMFTSCGWFFADICGLEAMQVLKYSAKAIDLAKEFMEEDIESRFVETLARAKSNFASEGSGADIYLARIKPLSTDPMRVAAQGIIINSLKNEEFRLKRLYRFNLSIIEADRREIKEKVLTVGRLLMEEMVTREKREFQFAVLNLGKHDFKCYLKPNSDSDDYTRTKEDLVQGFQTRSISAFQKTINSKFPSESFSFASLFEKERNSVMEMLTFDVKEQIGNSYDNLFNKHKKFMESFIERDTAVPEEILVAAKYVFEKRLNGLFADIESLEDYDKLVAIFNEAKKWGVRLGYGALRENVLRFLTTHLKKLCFDGECKCPIMQISKIVVLLKEHEVFLDDWEIGNLLYPHFLAAKDPQHKFNAVISQCEEILELMRFYNFDV